MNALLLLALLQEKDLEIKRLKAELSMKSDLYAKARHALQQFTKLCAERHVERP